MASLDFTNSIAGQGACKRKTWRQTVERRDDRHAEWVAKNGEDRTMTHGLRIFV